MRHIVCGRGKDSKETKMAHCYVVFCTNDIRYKERYFAETGKQLKFARSLTEIAAVLSSWSCE